MKEIMESSAQTLIRIRSYSCYKTLRFVINACFIPMMMFGLLMLMGGALGYGTPVGLVYKDDVIQKLLVAGSGFVFFILCVAARQMCLLLVDIADTLIAEHSRNRTR